MTSSTLQSAAQPGISRWWRVVGGLSMNLALGSLYAWSVFVGPLEKEFGWKRADTSTVFTIAVVVFALTFILAGRIQDKIGPFPVALTGGILVSLGFFLCAYTHSLTYLFVSFGVIGGLGNGFGYATPIPVMAKWFPDQPRFGGGPCRSRLWRRFRHLWSADGQLSAAGVWLADELPNSGGNFPGDDGLWGVPAEEPACRLPSSGLDAGAGFQIGRHHL